MAVAMSWPSETASLWVYRMVICMLVWPMTATRASSGMFARAAIVAIQCLAEWILTCGSPAAFSALHHWYRSVLEQTGLPRADVNTKSRMPMLFALIQPHNRFHNWVPIGSERVSKDGYLQRKLTDTGNIRDFVAVHHIIWHEAGRTIPPNHALIFKDGDKTKIELDNLELISRADLMRRNSVHNYGPEIAQLHQLQGVITRRINQRLRKSA